ncbi:MAG: hypothetical protein E6G97_16275 [Alphaproteobacteria bacterium]|nr:MAG: hypothetical protein E6G97_16275 [Alphaproteobacteria bacterium]
MPILSKGWILTCGVAALIAAACVGRPEPARAQFGINIGGFPLGINLHGGFRYRGGRRHRAPRGEKSEDKDIGDSRRPGKPDKVITSAGAPTSAQQTKVLQKIVSSATISDVGSTKDLAEVGQQALSNDRKRDYTQKINDIIEKFKEEQRNGKDTTPGDVTAHGIEQSLEKAVKNAKLEVFERFVNEAWTSERLRAMILDRVFNDLRPLFEGNNRGNAPMDVLDSLIQRTAESIYRRIFETSELLASNRSSALFMQRLYQAHGALVDNDLRESADTMITKASMSAIGRYESAMRRDPDGYALRYRAQRIVFDCLSENVERMTSSETKIKTIGEIERKIAETGISQCSAWLENQFGSEKGDLKPQKPMPVRVIWSANGPKDDPSMYGRITF